MSVFAFLPPPTPPPPPKNRKNQNFEKSKEIAGDIIIFHMCTKNQSYEVWFLRYRVRQTLLVILCHILP